MIKVLDDSMINKIAAGEVVERPASVIKELVENAIDAGATSITIEIKDGGKSYIRITDNGCGIPKDEVVTAFLRHATSKISTIDDLESILSLGFRGEALSSISSVAQVEIVTKTKDDELGTNLIIEGGKIIEQKEVSALVGTTFVVRNIFYNVPARLKFLKKIATEGNYITEMVTYLILSKPNIAFRYINNGATIMQTNGNGNVQNVIHSVYGKDISAKLEEVDYKDDVVQISGFVAKPEVSRATRKFGHFYINNRYIKSKLLQTAVEDAYKNKMMVGKFPVFVLYIDIDPTVVDVNVHPTKLEVRFSDEAYMYDVVYNAVYKVIQEQDTIRKVEIQVPIPSSSQILAKKTETEIEQTKLDVKPIYNEKPIIDVENYKKDIVIDNGKLKVSEGLFVEEVPRVTIGDRLYNNKVEVKQEVKEEVKEEIKEVKKRTHDYKIVGQVMGTYWILEKNDSMYILDQHAGHERLLYERYTKMYNDKKVSLQYMLEPKTLNLTHIESEFVRENIEMFKEFGFVIEEFGVNTFVVRSVPIIFDEPSSIEFFVEILDTLITGDKKINNVYDFKVDEIISKSCKAAVKANNALDYKESRQLVDDILVSDNLLNCPHGRPTVVEVTKKEIEKLFKRVL